MTNEVKRSDLGFHFTVCDRFSLTVITPFVAKSEYFKKCVNLSPPNSGHINVNWTDFYGTL